MRNLLMLCVIVLVAGSVKAGLLSDLMPGTHADELKQEKSPDSHSTAILIHKERRGLPLPGPEPPKTLSRWARLKWIKDSKTVYDSGDEPLNIYQMSPGFALDLMWSPDSTHLAYRHITTLRIIGPDGKATTHNMAQEDSAIASFRWIDDENLLVVSKKERYPLEMHGKPYYYNGYIDQAKDIRITRLNLTKGFTEYYQQAVSDPTFLFHSVDFCLDEISPKADRVAFSDGTNLCIYDVIGGKILGQIKIPQKPAPKPDPTAPGMEDPMIRRVTEKMAAKPAQLEGVWWQTNDKLVIGVGLLGGPVMSFYTYHIPSNILTDETSVLLPVWEKNRDYQNSDWYRSAIK